MSDESGADMSVVDYIGSMPEGMGGLNEKMGIQLGETPGPSAPRCTPTPTGSRSASTSSRPTTAR